MKKIMLGTSVAHPIHPASQRVILKIVGFYVKPKFLNEN
jgi:hypothetical protein